jgi:thiol-disulfide isomerase/thioredoxin
MMTTMTKYLSTLLLATATLLAGSPLFAASTNDPTVQLKALITKVKADIQAGKKTEAALADDLKQFDVLLAEHKGEKTDAVANILFMKATLYAEVLQDNAKADAIIAQLKTEFPDTHIVAALKQQEAVEAAAKKQQEAVEAAAKKTQASLVAGAKFPDFTEKDPEGKPLSLANYKGKLVLIDFWATWCGPCRAEIPNVVATYKKYHGQGFEIIGVSLDDDRQKMLTYTKENGMAWPQYFDGQGWGNKLAVKFGIEAIPATYLLNGNGVIIGTDLRGNDLSQAVAKALAKK